uniref:Activin types I and II receptor domain-containing protein n=1 Tax=Onchocerca volvulus TaxID=6282 RepID=A0A8R1TPI6_ONCVO
MFLIQPAIQLITYLILQTTVEAIVCFHCHSELGTCNSGKCEGAVCIKMETSNRYNDRRTVQKGCGKKYEKNGCQQSVFGSKWISRCVCDQMMCNNDKALEVANLEATSDTVTSTTLPGVLIFIVSLILVFTVALCSFFIIIFCHICFRNGIICCSVK